MGMLEGNKLKVKKSILEIHDKNYYVFECPASIVEMYQMKMFYYQNIKGIQDFRFSMSQDKSYIYIPRIHTKSMADKCFESTRELYDFLRYVVSIIEHGNQYLLYQDNYVLNPDWILFADRENNYELELVYLPIIPLANDLGKRCLGMFISELKLIADQLHNIEFHYFLSRIMEIRAEDLGVEYFIEQLDNYLKRVKT